MSSKAPPGGPKRRRGGKLSKLTPEHKRKRLERRKRKRTWAARVWARRHIKKEI